MRKLTDIQDKRRLKGEAQEMFLTYVRTLQLYGQRLRREALPSYVHLDQKHIERQYFTWPEYSRKDEIKKLIEAGKLDVVKSDVSGRDALYYKCLEAGPIDISLIEQQDESHYRPIHFEMREMLRGVSLPPGAPSTDYFNTFLQYKEQFLNTFFRVDRITGRVYTPVTNFHRTHRPNILLDRSTTTSFDVAQMQPLLLGKILTLKIGNNEYSEALNEGKDIYNVIAHKAGLDSRDAGKKRFFEIIFAPANDDLVKMFGDANWIRWVNDFKCIRQPNNPRTDKKRYGNMAWALTLMEVKMMNKVWQTLKDSGIKFLSVHDEIIVRNQDRHKAEGIFRGVLDNEFTSYKLNFSKQCTEKK